MAGIGVITVENQTRQLTPRSTAPVFSSSTSYAVGDLVYNDGTLYKCTTAHNGVWNASHFTAVTISGELQAKATEIEDLKTDLSQFQTLHIFCESGTYTRDEKTDNVARIRNVYPISIRNIESIVIPDGYEAWIFKLDVNRSFIGAYPLWVHGEVAIADVTDSQTYYLNMGLRLISDPSADISSDVETVSNGLIIKNAVDESITELKSDVEGLGADITELRTEVENMDSGLSDEAKEALLACFRHVAWTDEHGQDYYDTLEASLYDDFPKITATFNSGTNVIYTDDPIDTLKQYLTVKYYASKSSTGETIPSTDYTLFGQLVEGDNSVRADYGEYKTTFIVNAVDFYNISTWDFANASELNMIRNDFYAASGFTVSSGYRPSCGDAGKTRTSFNVTKGKDGAYLVDQNNSGAEIVPHVFLIPVPPTATTLTFTITPSTQYASMRSWIYNGNGNWTRESETGWKQGTGTLTRTAQANRYVSLNCKPASDGSVVYNDTTYPVPSVVFNFT